MSSIRFEPPIDPWILAFCGVAILAIGVCLRLVFGQPARPVQGRLRFALTRLLVLIPLLVILAGPTWVDEVPGRIDRPDLFLLLDSSQSMDIGRKRSRWLDAVSLIESARSELEPVVQSHLRLFEFGHRLSAIDATEETLDVLAERGPQQSDTRLSETLRQLTGRFGRQPPDGVVIFSDGRVRDVDGVRDLAQYFAERGVPLHVVPPQDRDEGGDIAIVSVVAPPRVRKFSNVDIQAFLRSSGYSGQRSEVSLVVPEQRDRPEEILASVPITLRGGAQSVSLSYRSDLRGRGFEVRVQPMPNELTQRNNSVPVDVQIERPKIRVLYIEGSIERTRFFQRMFSEATPTQTGPYVPLRDALTADEDIECVTLVRANGADQLTRAANNAGAAGVTYGFPRTQAELSAFDCVILSDLPARLLTRSQMDWLMQWVRNRGGGLLMAGGSGSFSSGKWDETPLADLLPVSFRDSRWVRVGDDGVQVRPRLDSGIHPIWQIVAERASNLSILDKVPGFPAAHLGLVSKPAADVLAVRADPAETSTGGGLPDSFVSVQNSVGELRSARNLLNQGEPLIVSGSYGRGRSLAVAFPIAPPDSDSFMEDWGPSGNPYADKFWRNVVYWLTENSSIGRRRLVARVDKRFYRPGETIEIEAVAYEETAKPTTAYDIWAMIEPQSYDLAEDDFFAPVYWPNGIPRESGEAGSRVVWGEEFQLQKQENVGQYQLPLELTEQLSGGLSDQGFRIELTAYERGQDNAYSHGTQVDSTSLEVQILDDPFEQQNTFANHDLLRGIASLSGGSVVESPEELAQLANRLPQTIGPSTLNTSPAWNEWWLWSLVIIGVTAEWLMRRAHGLA